MHSARDRVGPYGFAGVGGHGMATSANDAIAGSAAESGAGAAGAGGSFDAAPESAGATGTNLQEAGVDEPDRLKTDGSRVLALQDDRLSVTDVSGPVPRLLGTLDLSPGHGGELLLEGERVLVLGSHWEPAPDVLSPGEVPPGAQTLTDTDLGPVGGRATMLADGTPSVTMTVVDLSDPSAPRVERVEEVQGSYLSARQRDGAVRVVVSSTPDLPFVLPGGPVSEDDAAARNREVLEASTAQDWLPQRMLRGDDGAVTSREPLLDCDQVSRPAEPSGLGVLSVLTLDLLDPQAPLAPAVAVTADGDLVYSSTDRLYVATTRGGWTLPEPAPWPPVSGLPGSDRLPPAPEPTRTQLHGFDISDRMSAQYLASGEVEGELLGRWAMSARDGYLRVATTRGDRWGMGPPVVAPDGPGQPAPPRTDSAVTVLAERDDTLEVVGSVGGLGAGEQVRAVRWFGDLATVVTFRQTDPLYTVDLSDPTAPAVLGELKVLGYSAYLHPLGDGLLLGVGQNATEDGQVTGAQVSTFDLRDLAAPALVDVVEEPDAWSEVEADSRAFTYLPEQRLAVTPVSGAAGSMLWAVAVGPDGSLETAAQWSPGTDRWSVRAVPVQDGRLAVLSEGSGKDGTLTGTLTLLSTPDLRVVGEVEVGGRVRH